MGGSCQQVPMPDRRPEPHLPGARTVKRSPTPRRGWQGSGDVTERRCGAPTGRPGTSRLTRQSWQGAEVRSARRVAKAGLGAGR
jgi:hypothetical protein